MAQRTYIAIKESVMNITKYGFAVAAVTVAIDLLLLRPAWAHTDKWLSHAHPHGLETVIGLSLAVALLVVVFIGLGARRNKNSL